MSYVPPFTITPDAISASTKAGQSGPFIDFMLGEILKTLKSHQGEELHTEVEGVKLISSFARTFAQTTAEGFKTRANREKVCTAFQYILVAIKTITMVNAGALAPIVGVSERTVKTYLMLMVEAGMISYTGTTNNGRWHITLKGEEA